MVLLTVLFATGCHRENVSKEGIYLGVIGFNDQLYVKDISLLNNKTYNKFTDFVDGLTSKNGTALYFADYTAIKQLKEYSEPPKLKTVAIVTFTDGLDNASINENDPQGYGSPSAYRDALHNKIMNDKVHGLNISAYSIGLKGNDVSDEAQFMETLRKLASSDDNVFQVANMNEAMERFSDIAASLYSVTTSVKLGVDVAGGYEDGQLLRFTFDDVNAAANSTKYIEATFYRSSSNRTLGNIVYHGFAQGPSSITSSSSQGVYYHFEFDNLAYSDGTAVSQSDMKKIKLWKQTSTGAWDKETEFTPEGSTSITEDKSSALIFLVLDCTTSLGNDFAKMQESAKQFIKTLANVNGGGTSGGGSGGGGATGQVVSNAVTDYDGNNYDGVWIGDRLWMKQNLKTKHYADGTSIGQGSRTSTTTPYWYYPNNSASNMSTYGLLYNWKAVMRNSSSSSVNPSGVQGICPTGWHVPSDAEWTQLENEVGRQSDFQCDGNSSRIAKALASTTGWNTCNETCAVGNNQSSNNATGFSAFPAGFYIGNYYNFGNDALFWSSTEGNNNVWRWNLDYNSAYVGRGSYYKSGGFSVRCVRD